jgi:hypothetical protein
MGRVNEANPQAGRTHHRDLDEESICLIILNSLISLLFPIPIEPLISPTPRQYFHRTKQTTGLEYYHP